MIIRLDQATAAFTLHLAALFLSSSALAQALPTDFPVPYRSITAQEESTIERTAFIALRHISQAHSEIHNNALTGARQDLTEATRLIETVRDYLSSAAAKSLIQIARRHLEYEASPAVLRDLPPIYAALERTSVYLPTDLAKVHIDTAKALLERNDRPGAGQELALAENSLTILELEPSLVGSQRQLTKAREFLDAGTPGKADDALQGAERQVRTLYTGMNSLLFQATRFLWLALRSYAAADDASARAYLERARGSLEQAALGGNTTGKEEAGRLSGEITGVEQKIAAGGKIARSALQALWEKSAALAERSASYLAAGYSDVATELWQDDDLIEARLHVRFAQTYQVTTGESGKAAHELDAAHAYLDKAARNSQLGAAVQRELRGIDSIVLAIDSKAGKKNATVLERYDMVEGKLSTLIQKR